mmetsp:Transcript_20571/g.40404  ORF Transcript_20571/g.40404 Transcript_20571/m.40404 type:complete len:231 (+) Transcript_20571:1284-1976(+)
MPNSFLESTKVSNPVLIRNACASAHPPLEVIPLLFKCKDFNEEFSVKAFASSLVPSLPILFHDISRLSRDLFSFKASASTSAHLDPSSFRERFKSIRTELNCMTSAILIADSAPSSLLQTAKDCSVVLSRNAFASATALSAQIGSSAMLRDFNEVFTRKTSATADKPRRLRSLLHNFSVSREAFAFRAFASTHPPSEPILLWERHRLFNNFSFSRSDASSCISSTSSSTN